MKTAYMARRETKYQSVIIDLMHNIDNAIESGINQGNYACYVPINDDLPNDIRQQMAQTLEKAGYYYRMPKCERSYDGWRGDLYISWEENCQSSLPDMKKKMPEYIWA